MASKNNSSTALTTQVTREQVVAKIETTDFGNTTSVAELLKLAKHADNANFTNETLPFFDWKEGETYVFILNGIVPGAVKDILTGEPKDAAELIAEDESKYIVADAVMMSVINRWVARGITFPQIIKVHFAGMAGAKGKEYRDLQVYLWKPNA